VVDELTRIVLELGFDTTVYGDRDATVEQLHVYAEKVIPGVRANVAASRAGGVGGTHGVAFNTEN
jgi:hypothetical protein